MQVLGLYYPLWVSGLYKPFPVAAGGGLFFLPVCALRFGNTPPHSSCRNLRQLRFCARPKFGLALYTLHRCPNFGRWLPSSQIAKAAADATNCRIGERGARFVTPLSIFSMRCAVVQILDDCETGFRFVTPFCVRVCLGISQRLQGCGASPSLCSVCGLS